MLNHEKTQIQGTVERKGAEGAEEKQYSLTTKDTKSTKVITEMKQEENTSQRIAAGTPAIIR